MKDCSSCVCSEVCRYKDIFEAQKEKILKFLKENKAYGIKKENGEVIVEVELHCKKYKQNMITPIFPYAVGTPTPLKVELADDTSNCENCWFTKRLKSGEPYIGDSPCEWCNKNPWRPTCYSELTKTGEKNGSN